MNRAKEKKFSEFKKANERNAANWLKWKYSVLSEEERMDIIQKSYDVLYKNIKNWEIIDGYYPYFLKTCKNFALKATRGQKQHPELRYDESCFDEELQNNDDVLQKNRVSQQEVFKVIRFREESEQALAEKIERVHRTLDAMATRCKDLLWSFYADELSWATIAGLYGLTSADSAKVAASRCRQTFKEKYLKLKG